MIENNILPYKVNPKFAFCEKSTYVNNNQFFDNKNIIYRKLINGFDDKIEKNCFIAIYISQIPNQGDLTLFDFETDCECLNEYDGENRVFGKLVAFSAVNDLTKFYSSKKLRKGKSTTEMLIPQNINQYADVLQLLLNSGLLKGSLYEKIDQLRRSLDLFETLLQEQYGEKRGDYE